MKKILLFTILLTGIYSLLIGQTTVVKHLPIARESTIPANYDYVIYKSGTNTEAYKMSTQSIFSTSSSFKTVFDAVYADMSDSAKINIMSGIYTTSVPLNGTGKSFTLEGIGRVEIKTTVLGEDGFAFSFFGSELGTTYLSSDVTKGTNTITVNDIFTARIGDLFVVYDDSIFDAQFDAAWKTGELHEVAEVTSTTLKIPDQFIHGYTLTNNAVVILVRPVSVNINNVTFTAPSSTGMYQGISLEYNKNSNITNCQMNSFGIMGIGIYYSYTTKIDNCKINDALVMGYGYGVSINNGAAYTTVQNSVFRNQRHSIAQGGYSGDSQARDTKIVNNYFFNANGIGHAIDAHAIVENFSLINNKIYSLGTSSTPIAHVASGAVNVIIKGNEFIGGTGISTRDVALSGISFYIDGNTFTNVQTGFYQEVSSDVLNNFVMKNNTFKEVCWGIAEISNAVRFDISGNFFNVTETSVDNGRTSAILISDSQDGLISNNTINNVLNNAIKLDSVSNTVISGNNISNWDRHAYDVLYPGVVINNSTDNIIANNFLKRPVSAYMDSNGIVETGTSDYNIISTNNVRWVGTVQANRIITTGANSQELNNLE